MNGLHYIVHIIEKIEGFLPDDYIFTYRTDSNSLLELWDTTEKALENSPLVDCVEIQECSNFPRKQYIRCCARF